MSLIDKPLTNLQLELLRLFSFDLPDKDLIEIRRLIANYFAEKASDEMDRLWDERGWTDETMEIWLQGDEEKKTDE